LRGDLEVVLEVTGVVLALHGRIGDVRGANEIGPSDIISGARHRALDWRQEHLGKSRVPSAGGRNFCIETTERPRSSARDRLENGEAQALPLESHLETVVPNDFGQVVRNL